MGWLLPTCNRPKLCAEVLRACERTGMREPAVLYIDGNCEAYDGLDVPGNFEVRRNPQRAGLSAAMRWYLEAYPNEGYYGLLSDDNIPKSPGWDVQLPASAGRWCCAYANDENLSLSSSGLIHLTWGGDLSSALCWGGDLVRAVGWWALPGTFQGGTDVAWCREILGPLCLARYCHHIVVEHRHHKYGSRARDATDSDSEADIELLNKWLQSGGPYYARKQLMDAVFRGHA